jgi:hypothetical protein
MSKLTETRYQTVWLTDPRRSLILTLCHRTIANMEELCVGVGQTDREAGDGLAAPSL